MIKECTLIEALNCNTDETIVEVAKKLREHLVRYVYVVDSEGKPVGVISTTDVNNRVVAEGKDPNTLKAEEIMTKPIVSFEETEDESKVYKECVKNEVATCPITKDGKIVGIITIHELLRKITHAE